MKLVKLLRKNEMKDLFLFTCNFQFLPLFISTFVNVEVVD